jgi:hypothetical protein
MKMKIKDSSTAGTACLLAETQPLNEAMDGRRVQQGYMAMGSASAPQGPKRSRYNGVIPLEDVSQRLVCFPACLCSRLPLPCSDA